MLGVDVLGVHAGGTSALVTPVIALRDTEVSMRRFGPSLPALSNLKWLAKRIVEPRATTQT